jgi:hypothetical protein
VSVHSVSSPCPSPTESVTISNGDVRSNPDTRPPLLSECDDCSGSGRICLGHANDPWVRTQQCETCDGSGEVIPECNGWRCREDATEWVDGAAWCPVHAAEQKADAESVA